MHALDDRHTLENFVNSGMDLPFHLACTTDQKGEIEFLVIFIIA